MSLPIYVKQNTRDYSILLLIYVEPCDTTEIGGLDLVFVIDDSASIGEEHFNRTKESVENIILSLRIGPRDTRVAVLLFSERTLLLFDLDKHTNIGDLIKEIRSIQYIAGGSTNTAEALELLQNITLSQVLGLRPSNESRHVAIVITDGRSGNQSATLMQAVLLHTETDFRVFAIGVGDSIVQVELMNIASDTSYVVLLDNFGADGLQRFEEEVRTQVCMGKLCTLICKINVAQKDVCYFQFIHTCVYLLHLTSSSLY